MHGHSYEVEAFFREGFRLPLLRQQLAEIVSRFDHGLLEDTIGSPDMESIATWVLDRLPSLSGLAVEVRRPTLGFRVRASR